MRVEMLESKVEEIDVGKNIYKVEELKRQFLSSVMRDLYDLGNNCK